MEAKAGKLCSRAWLEEGDIRARKALGRKFMIASYELRMIARTQMSDLQPVDGLHEFVGGLVTGRRFMIVASHMCGAPTARPPRPCLRTLGALGASFP